MTEENLNSDFTDPAEFMKDRKPASLEIVSINKSKVFSTEQCKEVLENCIEELWLPVHVVGDNNLNSFKRQKLRGDVQGFPFLDIREVTRNANTEVYDFSLLGIIDQDFPQVFMFSEKDFYDWHIELSPMTTSRKLSFIVNLSDPKDYKGGKIEFLNVNTGNEDINEQGSCLIFPSYMPYRINPVTEGTKHIIVGHVHGALFK